MNIYSFQIKQGIGSEYVYHHLDSFSFLYRSKLKEIIDVFISVTNERTENLDMGRLYQFNVDKIPDARLYLKITESRSYYFICNQSIERLTISTLLNQIEVMPNDNKKDQNLNNLLGDFNKNPNKYISKIDTINKQLTETKEIINESFEKLIARGEKLDDLMEKSQQLSEQSKIFLKRTKKLNCPCVIM